MFRRTVEISSKAYGYDSEREFQYQIVTWWFLFIPLVIRESAVVNG